MTTQSCNNAISYRIGINGDTCDTNLSQRLVRFLLDWLPLQFIKNIKAIDDSAEKERQSKLWNCYYDMFRHYVELHGHWTVAKRFVFLIPQWDAHRVYSFTCNLLLSHKKTIHLLPKGSVFHIKVRLFWVSDEKLRSISIRPIVSHGDNPPNVVLQWWGTNTSDSITVIESVYSYTPSWYNESKSCAQTNIFS